jgi:putative spermidine/putrescine transport system ATP-binding protein
VADAVRPARLAPEMPETPTLTREHEFEQLRLEGVTRRFGGEVALEAFDLTIRRGEFVALLGPSGSGKSTALNCLAGLLPLSGGRIWLDDRRLDPLPPERRGFGMVFQNYALFPHLTIRRNVAFGLVMRKRPKAEIDRRVEEALSLVHLSDHADKLPDQLSGGQQQRVAIARAVVFEPPVVLMDEPLSNLDARLRLEMRTEIRRLHQSLGLTTVYVTHDQEEAMSLADRLVILRGGRVEQAGSPREVYENPATAFVASFVGYRNLLSFGLERTHDRQATLVDGGVRLQGVLAEPVRGERALAAIRPEDITPADDPGENRIEATVEVVEYGGRELAVEARTDSGQPLHFLSDRPLHPGERVTVGVPPERVLVFGADG